MAHRRPRLLLGLYVGVIALLTLAPAVEPYVLAQVTAAAERVIGHSGPQTGAWVEWLSNVALFVPAALLLCRAFPQVARVQVWAWCTLTSAAVELVQWTLLPARTASLADVAANGAGAALGVLVHWWPTGGEARSGAPAQS